MRTVKVTSESHPLLFAMLRFIEENNGPSRYRDEESFALPGRVSDCKRAERELAQIPPDKLERFASDEDVIVEMDDEYDLAFTNGLLNAFWTGDELPYRHED